MTWVRANLFSSWLSTAVTLALAYLLARGLLATIDWGILRAVWSVPQNDSEPCRLLRGTGACWAVVQEKYRFILFGAYPFAEQWRPALCVLLFIVLYGLSACR